MKIKSMIFLVCVMSMHSAHIAPSDILSKTSQGLKEAYDYVVKYGSMFGDLNAINVSITKALNRTSNSLNNVSKNIDTILDLSKDMHEKSIDINTGSSSAAEKSSPVTSQDSTPTTETDKVVENAAKKIKNGEAILLDLTNIVDNVRSAIGSIARAAPSIETMLNNVGKMMRKIDDSKIQEQGKQIESAAKTFKNSVIHFNDDFIEIQKQIDAGADATIIKINEILTQAQEPIKQLQTIEGQLPDGIAEKLVVQLHQHPYNPATTTSTGVAA